MEISIRRLPGLRECSSSSVEEQSQKYLETWLGQHNSITSRKNSKTFSNDLKSLHMRNSSFFLPTLTLNRSDTPSSLKSDLQGLFDGSNIEELPATYFKLQSKNTLLGKGQNEKEKLIWRTPVVLDMKAFQHCGSPHFKPLAYGTLKDFVSVLSDWGMQVIGVTNITRSNNSMKQSSKKDKSTIKSSEFGIDVEAAELGLPILMGKPMSILKSRNAFDSSQLLYEGLDQSTPALKNLLSSRIAGATSVRNSSIVSKESDLDLEHPKSISFNDINQNQNRAITKSIDSPVNVEEIEHLKTSTTNGADELGTTSSDNKIYRGSVRSGQQISTDEPNQSLIVIGNVNSGGEVLADGDIHVYGALRGRALAGLSPDKSKGSDAKIFASIFDAELVCIGQAFTTVDSLEDLGLDSNGGAFVRFDSSSGRLCFKGF